MVSVLLANRLASPKPGKLVAASAERRAKPPGGLRCLVSLFHGSLIRFLSAVRAPSAAPPDSGDRSGRRKFRTHFVGGIPPGLTPRFRVPNNSRNAVLPIPPCTRFRMVPGGSMMIVVGVENTEN